MNLLTLQARETLNLPEAWSPYEWKCLPEYNEKLKIRYEPTHYSLTGAVAPLITRGPRKGDHNWRKLDPATLRNFIVSIPEHRAWCLAWEQKHQKCHHCTGSGKTISRVSAEGTEYRTCARCKGSGQPPTAESAKIAGKA